VTWQEAKDYATWLGEQPGYQKCRLPNEAEWEYAARAKTNTGYWWGPDVGENNANCKGCGSDSDGLKSAPVGSFEKNPFGLFDMSGNVLEWTCSAWTEEFNGEIEQSCPNKDNSDENKDNFGKLRVIRDGSFQGITHQVRVTKRRSYALDRNASTIGFRVLCESLE
jgi:formylglycine-generating enzyme required for sulfatase activity